MKIQKVTQEAILMSNMDNDITLNRNKDISADVWNRDADG